MAEFELSVQYNAPRARVGMVAMMVLMPLWAIAVPFCLGLFLSLIIQQGDKIPALPAFLVLGVLSALPVLAILMSAYFEDDQIAVSKEGFMFPLLMLPTLKFRRERLWDDLAGAEMLSPETIALTFKSGGRTNLNLANMKASEVEQLLLAVEVWGNQCQRDPLLIEYQTKLQNTATGAAHPSYTEMWEEELRRRFNTTSFVPLEPGRVLQNNGFKIVRQLAFGGLSAIYLAQHHGKELVVLKEAVVPANSDERARGKAAELFAREATLLIKLNHPSIAKVLDHFVEEGRNYLVLEYIQGQDLRRLVKEKGPQAPDMVLLWASQIANVLEYLHTQEPPIIHRDLTSDNLVLRDDGNIVLIDFGAANEFVGTATGTLVGKQAYIAPEQLRGKATLQSDIYAFGGTLYFLLTGQDPDALSVSHPKEIMASVPDDLDELIASCTQMEAEDRPADAQSISDKLATMSQRNAGAPAI